MDKRIAVRRRKIKRGIYNVVYVPVRYSPLLALEVHFALLQNKLCKRRGNANGYIAYPVPRLRLCRAKRMARALGAEPVGIAAETTLPSMRINYFIREAFAAAYMQLAGTLY